MTDFKLYLFSAPSLEYHNQGIRVPRRKALALAAFLALAEQPQSREAVAALFWPDLDQARAHAALRSTLPALTAHGPAAWLAVDRGTLAVNRGAIWVDVSEFRRLLALSRRHGHGPEAVCAECLPLLGQALALYRGDFMAGFSLAGSAEYDTWQTIQREALQRELAGFLRRASAYCAQADKVAPAIDYARRWLALDNLHEPAQRQLMRLYAASRHRTEALREGLGITTDTHMALDQAHGLLVAARLWRQRGQARQAAEWLGLLLSRAGAEWVVRQAAAELARDLKTELGPDEFAAAGARSQALKLDQAVAQIIAALDDPNPEPQ